MSKLLIVMSCLFSLQVFAQDTAKAKPNAYLGVLTLTEK